MTESKWVGCEVDICSKRRKSTEDIAEDEKKKGQ
jgi:hypothetical protein